MYKEHCFARCNWWFLRWLSRWRIPGMLVLCKWFFTRLTLKLCILTLRSLIKCILYRSSCEERIIWTKEKASSYSINRNYKFRHNNKLSRKVNWTPATKCMALKVCRVETRYCVWGISNNNSIDILIHLLVCRFVDIINIPLDSYTIPYYKNNIIFLIDCSVGL